MVNQYSIFLKIGGIIINEMIKEAYLDKKITIKSDGLKSKNFIHYEDVCRKH